MSLVAMPIAAILLPSSGAGLALVLALAGVTAGLVRGVRYSRARETGARVALLTAGLVAAGVLAGALFVIPLYSGMLQRARIAKAEADVNALRTAVQRYASHMAALPETFADLTRPAVNAKGGRIDRLLHTVPRAPSGWREYRYERGSGISDTITTSGDGGVFIGSNRGVEWKPQ